MFSNQGSLMSRSNVIVLLLEMFAVFLIALGVFYIALPLGLIFVGVSLLAFTLAWERSKKVDNR